MCVYHVTSASVVGFIVAISGVFWSFNQATNGQINGILTSREVIENTQIQSIKLRIRQTARAVSDNYP